MRKRLGRGRDLARNFLRKLILVTVLTARILELKDLPAQEKYHRLLKAVIWHAAGGTLTELLQTLKDLEGT